MTQTYGGDQRLAGGDRAAQPCPCGLGEPYGRCCGRYHTGEDAPTAEALMRSRYSAFAVGDVAYLRRTWHPRTRPRNLDLDPGQRWSGLEIVGGAGGGLFDTDATVEFRARYRDDAGRGELRENSRFVRLDGQWRYLDGTGH
ncbi:YchJ family protein [Pilimelia columellifera]|uniref:UPF0225 protein GCM10010201_23030 n=1 Tax=Pilimelia columellifera subsp. columellifera TaxID=706583 RepID=A0ABN3NJD2_9ACTN